MNTSRSSSSQSSTRQSPTSFLSSSNFGAAAAAAPPPRPSSAASGPSTDAFLRDFTLVAEAAKRAQMACLMRDMEGFGLS